MRYVTHLLPALLLLATAWVAVGIFSAEKQQQEMKRDLIELQQIKYGLFNVDEWKQILARIITEKVEEFDLEGDKRENTRKKIEQFLYQVLDDFEKSYYKEKSKSLFGWVQSGVATLTDTFGQLKKNVPTITNDILNFLDKEENREAIRQYIIEKINTYADGTFSKVDYSAVETVRNKYGGGSTALTMQFLKEEVGMNRTQNRRKGYLFMGLGLGIAVFLVLLKRPDRWTIMICSGVALIFLICGVLLPMIEIDARIAEMSFTMLGEPVRFTDQVLFFKSKSVMEVFFLLIEQGKADLILVAFLIVLFSVLFPFSKLLATQLYLFIPRMRDSKVLRFLIFRTGKWSMADVMVVAIFMSYIGFSGIIGEQLAQLEGVASKADVFTTNDSSLMLGFFSFALFVLLSLLISDRMHRFDGTPHFDGDR